MSDIAFHSLTSVYVVVFGAQIFLSTIQMLLMPSQRTNPTTIPENEKTPYLRTRRNKQDKRMFVSKKLTV